MFIETVAGFELITEMEGGGYIINGGAATEFKKQLASLKVIYASKVNLEKALTISEYTTVYNP